MIPAPPFNLAQIRRDLLFIAEVPALECLKASDNSNDSEDRLSIIRILGSTVELTCCELRVVLAFRAPDHSERRSEFREFGTFRRRDSFEFWISLNIASLGSVVLSVLRKPESLELRLPYGLRGGLD